MDGSHLYKGVWPYLCSQLDFPCTVRFGKSIWATIEGYIWGMQGGGCGTPSFALQLGFEYLSRQPSSNRTQIER